INSGVGSPEERTLRAVADWAIEQTLPNHRRFLERLSLLSGWFDLRLAAVVAGAAPASPGALTGPYNAAEWDTLRLLGALADRALLRMSQFGPAASPQHFFRLPGAVRSAALGGLHLNEGPATPARLIARHAAELATHAADALTRPDGHLWRQILQDRLPLLHEAQQLAAQHNLPDADEQIRAGLDRFWTDRGL